MAKGRPDLIDQRLAKAMENPIRIEILAILVREGPSSSTQIQRQLENVSLNLVSHHIKVLKELGCIEPLETVSKRGAKVRAYRAVGSPILSAEDWDALTPEVRLPIVMTLLRTVSNELARSLSAGKFDEIADRHLSRSPLQLDREGWSEVVELLAQTLEGVGEIQGKSTDRIALSGETPTPVTVVILQFPTIEVTSSETKGELWLNTDPI